ncbi:MAG TPA: inositol monophosphatase family protein, partial [Alphaproteobacteria bacterium]|nr:inositol monophosphatase family protein [Alphaproteobacteria bacterium]
VTGIPFKGHDSPTFMTEVASVMTKVAGIRRMGAASLDLAYVAAGRYEGFWERNLQPWDVAAGVLLVREAGGFATSMKKGEDPVFSGSLVAANDGLHSTLCGLLAPA